MPVGLVSKQWALVLFFLLFFDVAKHVNFVIFPKHLAAPYHQRVCVLPSL